MKLIFDMNDVEHIEDIKNDMIGLRYKYQLLLEQETKEVQVTGTKPNPLVQKFQMKMNNYNEIIQSIDTQIEEL